MIADGPILPRIARAQRECYRSLLWSFLHRVVRIEGAYRLFCCLAFTLLSPLLCSEYEPNCLVDSCKVTAFPPLHKGAVDAVPCGS